MTAAAAPRGDASARIVDAALRLAARDGWHATSLAAIATEAGIGLAELYDAFENKAAILAGLMRQADRAVLATGEDVSADSPRDRLFDVIMRRFDALQPYRAGIAAIAAAAPDPLAGLQLLEPIGRSMRWMLEAAGIGSAGLTGRLRVAGLVLIYTRAFRVWLADDSADLGKTMAAVDRGLARAERWAPALPRRRRRRGDGIAAPQQSS